jgi:lipopolysaccharide transport system ATP-binding protein
VSASRQPILDVRHLTREFIIPKPGRPAPTLAARLAGRLGSIGRRREQAPAESIFRALDDVSFSVGAGEVVGIIGRNGAGKSTLLKILSRVMRPSAGEIDIYGRVGSLLEVGTGFHPDLSGRENIFLNGALIGMPRAEVEAKFAAIVEFAEVSAFLDAPLKHYSSGMYLRLAFAVAIHLDAEVLLLDEVMSVGDEWFSRKCRARIEETCRSGRTVLVVGHDLGTLSAMCQRLILLDRGRLVTDGSPPSVIERYLGLYNETADGPVA